MPAAFLLGKKHIKRGAKIELWASLLFMSFGLAHPHTSRMYFPLFANKAELQHGAVTLYVRHFKFLLQQDRTEEITNFADRENDSSNLAWEIP